MEPNLLTVSQAAARRGVSRAAVYSAIARGVLPHQHVLGHIALREADVLAWAPLGAKTGRRKGTPMSAEAKARIAAGQRRRWAQRKNQNNSS